MRVLLLVAVVAAGAHDPLPRGEIVPRVVCRADPTQAYALYLPTAYTSERRWPILYAYDPAAIAARPLEAIRVAAERFGWFVAASHNSRNGPLPTTLDAARVMREDTFERLSVDPKRVYATGFSGGARVAFWTASLCDGCVAGVIACGAGFPFTPGPTHPSLKIGFAVYATIGSEDFNYPELWRLDSTLDDMAVHHRVERFDGGHAWAPADVFMRALGFLEAEAMRSGTRPRDSTLLAALEEEWLARAGELEARATSSRLGVPLRSPPRPRTGWAPPLQAGTRRYA